MNRQQKKQCEEVVKEFLFVGAALLDVTAHCDPETLQKFGLKADDCIRETDRQENLLQSVFCNPDYEKTAGGSSQNSARIAKWTLGERGKVAFLGCVGTDEHAETMQECLESEGVEPLYVPLSGKSTGICSCLLSSDGDRSMITRLGAAAHITHDHLQIERIRERIRKADCIFVAGYVLGHSPDVMTALAETCSNNQIFSMSLSAAYVCKDYSDILAKVLPRIDVMFSNETEAKILAQSLRLRDVSSVEDIARILASMDSSVSRNPRIVVVTRGPNSVLVAQGSDPLRYFPVSKGVKVVDGVGCGDAMAGAFLAVYVLTGDVSLAAKTGISASLEILKVTGCRITGKQLYPPEDQ